MLSFDAFIPDSGGMPIYLQIILYIKRGIVAGTIADGDELPSRRVLSALLGINPNTVQKAYRILEDEGLILSRTGAKSYVSLTPATLTRVRADLHSREARAAARTLRALGLTLEDAQSALATYWNEPEEEVPHETDA